MKSFLNYILIRLKTLISPSYIISILIMPFILFFILSNIDLKRDTKIKLGFVFENVEDEKFLNKSLMENFGEGIEIINFENRDDLKKEVMSYKINCGFVFTENFNSAVNNSIILYETDNTISADILKILVGTVSIQSESGRLGYKTIKKYLLIKNSEVLEKEIKLKAFDYTKNGLLMDITYNNQGNFTNEKLQSSFDLNKILYGLFGSIALWISLQNTIVVVKEKNSEIYSRIKLSETKFKYEFGVFISFFILNFFYLSLSQLILGLVYKTNISFLTIIFSNILFSLLISIISIVFIFLFRNDSYISSFSIMIFLFSFIFSESIFKIKEVAIFLDFFKFLSPVFYYLKMLF